MKLFGEGARVTTFISLFAPCLALISLIIPKTALAQKLLVYLHIIFTSTYCLSLLLFPTFKFPKPSGKYLVGYK